MQQRTLTLLIAMVACASAQQDVKNDKGTSASASVPPTGAGGDKGGTSKGLGTGTIPDGSTMLAITIEPSRRR